MSKKNKNLKGRASKEAPASKTPLVSILLVLAITGIAYGIFRKNGGVTQRNHSTPVVAAANTPRPLPPPATNVASQLPVIDINQAVMVTVELDFGPRVPTIAEALKSVERRYEPADGKGRTFAILDAYGEPTADGKKLHISMHVSTEKVGIGSLVFKPTGVELWKSRIVATNANYSTHKNLLILFADGTGRSYTVDGSSNPLSILDANLKELGAPLKSIWFDGEEREFTFVYSACGCPVKAMVQRVGDRTRRTKELPVMFPDDPAALEVISRLMRWVI
ncbi:MAG TPA: hypothetical protein VMZ27_02525 [Candidatus Saccharimonadales bacterium]|nr:hypothetical protein [Candidatus Saccharimonadales bacterium]